MALLAALPESNTASRPPRSPSKKPIAAPTVTRVPYGPGPPTNNPAGRPEAGRPAQSVPSSAGGSHPGRHFGLLVGARVPLGLRDGAVAADGGPEGPGDQDD